MFSSSTFAKASLVLKSMSSLAFCFPKLDKVTARGLFLTVATSTAFAGSYECSGVSLSSTRVYLLVILPQGRFPDTIFFIMKSLLAS